MIFSLLQRSSVNILIVTQYTTGALPKDLTVLYAEDLPQEKRRIYKTILLSLQRCIDI